MSPHLCNLGAGGPAPRNAPWLVALGSLWVACAMRVPPEHSTGSSGDPADSGEPADPGHYDFGSPELPEPDYSDCDNIWEELELLYEEAQAEIQAEAEAARAELAEGDEAGERAIDAAEEEALAELEAQLEERVEEATEACGPPH